MSSSSGTCNVMHALVYVITTTILTCLFLVHFFCIFVKAEVVQIHHSGVTEVLKVVTQETDDDTKFDQHVNGEFWSVYYVPCNDTLTTNNKIRIFGSQSIERARKIIATYIWGVDCRRTFIVYYVFIDL